jgi:hypothetical protein
MKLNNLFNNQKYSDIKIRLDNKIIYAHKCVLINSCNFFHKLILKNNNENEEEIKFQNDEIIISKNQNEEAIEDLIKFFYTECINIGDEKRFINLILLCQSLEINLKLKMKMSKLLSIIIKFINKNVNEREEGFEYLLKTLIDFKKIKKRFLYKKFLKYTWTRRYPYFLKQIVRKEFDEGFNDFLDEEEKIKEKKISHNLSKIFLPAIKGLKEYELRNALENFYGKIKEMKVKGSSAEILFYNLESTKKALDQKSIKVNGKIILIKKFLEKTKKEENISNKIVVKNLNKVSMSLLKKTFESFGEIEKIIYPHFKKIYSCYAIIEYSSLDLEKIQNKIFLNGIQVSINFIKKKEMNFFNVCDD